MCCMVKLQLDLEYLSRLNYAAHFVDLKQIDDLKLVIWLVTLPKHLIQMLWLTKCIWPF